MQQTSKIAISSRKMKYTMPFVINELFDGILLLALFDKLSLIEISETISLERLRQKFPKATTLIVDFSNVEGDKRILSSELAAFSTLVAHHGFDSRYCGMLINTVNANPHSFATLKEAISALLKAKIDSVDL